MESGEGRVLADATAADRGLTWGETAAYGEWSERFVSRTLMAAIGIAAIDSSQFRPQWSWPEGTALEADDGWTAAPGLDRRRGARHGARRRRAGKGLRRAPRGPRRARHRRARAAVARPRHQRPAGAAGRLVHGLAGAGCARCGGHRPSPARLPGRQGAAGRRPGATRRTSRRLGRAAPADAHGLAGRHHRPGAPAGRRRTYAGPGSARRPAACGGGSPSPARTAPWCCAGAATGSRRRPRSRSGSATASRRSWMHATPAVRNVRNAVGLGGMTLGALALLWGVLLTIAPPGWRCRRRCPRCSPSAASAPCWSRWCPTGCSSSSGGTTRARVCVLLDVLDDQRRDRRRRPRRRRARSAPVHAEQPGERPRRRASPAGGAAARPGRR